MGDPGKRNLAMAAIKMTKTRNTRKNLTWLLNVLTKIDDESFKLEKQTVSLRFLRSAGKSHAPGKSINTCHMHSHSVLAC